MPVKLIASTDVVATFEPPHIARGGSPTPSVPITPQRRPSDVSACAIHHDVDVLPFVPVIATTLSFWLGMPMDPPPPPPPPPRHTLAPLFKPPRSLALPRPRRGKLPRPQPMPAKRTDDRRLH